MNIKRIPIGGLNTDDSYYAFPEEDYLNAEGVSISVPEDGTNASVKSIRGNLLVPFAGIDTPSKAPGLTVVGSYEDKANARLLYFVHDVAEVDHRILMYDYFTGTIKTVLQGGFINFTGRQITAVSMHGNLLYWAEDQRPPKRVNVERGLRTYDGTYSSPDGTIPEVYDLTTIAESDLTVIKAPPVQPLSIFLEQQARDTDFISGNAFQFAYRYVYRDGETSVLSPYTKLVNYKDDDSTDEYNSVTLTMSEVEKIPYEVSRVEFLVREGNAGVWYVFSELRRDDQEAFIDAHNDMTFIWRVEFFNDKVGLPVADQVAYKPFESVPIESKALEVARNRLFLANNKVGYGRPVKADLTVGHEEASGSAVTGVYKLVDIVYTDSAVPNRVVVVLIDSGIPEDGYYFYKRYAPGDSAVEFTGATLPTTITISTANYLAPDTATDAELGDATALYLNDNFGLRLGEVGFEYTTDSVDPYSGGAVSIGGIGSFTGNYAKYKSGGAYQLGIVYYDKYLRNAGVSTSDQYVVNVPIRTWADAIDYFAINWTINNLDADIPEWAHYYSIVRTKSLNIESFIQHITGDVLYIKKDSDGLYDIAGGARTFTGGTDGTEYIAINLENAINDGYGYQLKEGDKCRLYPADAVTYGDSILMDVVDQVGSYVILGNPVDLGDTTPSSGAGSRYILYELYTPKRPLSETLFYEVGDIYNVIDPGEATRAFSATTGALVAGDIYIKERDESDTDGALSNILMEAMNPSDEHYSEWLQDTGRPNVQIRDVVQEVRPSNIAFSNQWLPGSRHNGMGLFDALDYDDVDQSNGPISKLVTVGRGQQKGSVMLAICEVDAASIYLGEAQLTASDGEAIIASSGNVIGSINNLSGGYGTVHPESVAEANGNVFWLDAISAKVVKYTSGGIYPVSDYKMARFFDTVCPGLATVGVKAVHACATYDVLKHEYMIVISRTYQVELMSDYDPVVQSPHHMRGFFTIVYNDKRQRWTHTLPMTPDHMNMVRDTLVSFDTGSLYAHSSSALVGRFFDISFPAKISFLINPAPNQIKSFESVSVEANTVPDWIHIRCDRPFQQSSDLEAAEIKEREGVYYASILRDRLDPNYGTAEEALLFGDRMRGNYAKVAVEYREYDAIVTLNALNVKYSESQGHRNLLQE